MSLMYYTFAVDVDDAYCSHNEASIYVRLELKYSLSTQFANPGDGKQHVRLVLL